HCGNSGSTNMRVVSMLSSAGRSPMPSRLANAPLTYVSSSSSGTKPRHLSSLFIPMPLPPSVVRSSFGLHARVLQHLGVDPDVLLEPPRELRRRAGLRFESLARENLARVGHLQTLGDLGV